MIILLLSATIFAVNASISDLLQQQTTRSMPVQMDMQTEDGITICTGDKKTVGCRDGANMAVTNAFWGRISDKVCPSDDGDPVTDCDGSPDTLHKVREYCEGKKECDLTAKHERLQRNGSSHCPGVNKYLVVNYTCIPESKGVTLCQDVATTLHCSAGWVMELADVFWGRRANSASTCGDDEGIECDNSESASKYLKTKCNNQKQCFIRADPDVLGSRKATPCLGKYLMVNYVCRPPTVIDMEMQVSNDEPKGLKETTSKELMGLLEKHLTEIKEPTAKHKSESSMFPAVQPASLQTGVKIAPSTGSVRGLEEKVKAMDKLDRPDASLLEKASEKSKIRITEDSPEEDSTSVRSILSRAKDILKTLDTEDKDSEVKKRHSIPRPVPGKRSKIQQKGKVRRSKIPVHRIDGYPENFLLRSWYGK